MDNSLPAVPVGWTWTTLDSLCDIVGGVTKDAKRQSDPSFVEVPYLRVANVQRGYFDLSDIATIRVPQKKVDALRLRPGDVLFTEGGDRDKLGRGWVWEGQIDPCIHQNHIFRARVLTPDVNPKFLSWHGNTFGQQWFESRGKQTTNLASINLSTLRQLPIPLPPPDEQVRIVAAIEEYLSHLDEATHLLRRVQRRARALATSLINRATDGYPTKALGDLIREPLRNGHSSRQSRNGEVPVFTLTAVTTRDFSSRNIKLTDADPQRVKHLWAEPGDIFVERSNTPELVGTAALYVGPSRRAVFPDLLIRVRVNSEILPEYAELGLRSSRVRGYFQQAAKGIAGSMPKVDQAAVLAVHLPLPSLDEQRSIIEQYQQRSSMVDAMVLTSATTLLRAQTLRSLILERALAGHMFEQTVDGSANQLMTTSGVLR